MVTVSAQFKIYIAYANSLKDKRQVCRSLVAKIRQKFNASVAEVDTQDLCQTLTLGVAVVSGSGKYAKQIMDEIERFVESNTDAELIGVEYE